MCGRYTLTVTAADLEREFGVAAPEDYRPSANISPWQQVLAVGPKSRAGARTQHDDPVAGPVAGPDAPESHDVGFAWFRWGLVPRWAKDETIGRRMINARSETAHEKPAFRDAFAKRRCLLPADGFYEWKKEGSGKQPYHIHVHDRSLITFAGLWERWTTPEGEPLLTCSILTTSPSEIVRPIHDRMPVVIPPELRARWLDSRTSPDELRSMCIAWGDGVLECAPEEPH